MSAGLVTGAGGALGRVISARLARDGLPVAVVDVNLGAAEETVIGIEQDGGRAISVGCDLRNEAEIASAFAIAQSELGPVTVLVNNAAVFPSGPFLEVSPEELDDTMGVNLRAYFIAAQHAARSMIESGGGVIVNIGSITWHGSWDQMSPYVMSKGGVVALTRALARELGVHGIRVNSVAPGAFPTRAEALQHPDIEEYERLIMASQALKRRGTFEELASVVSFLCSEESSFVTGQTINVDGGWTMT